MTHELETLAYEAVMTLAPGADERFQATGGLIHRWLVRRLGESLLEYYAEAMAERDAEAEDQE